MELLERGQRVVRKLLSRVSGPAGWATWAAELAVRGFDAVTDIIEDIERILWIIDRLLEMKGEVTGWVEEQRERLSLLLDLVDLARRELPVVAAAPGERPAHSWIASGGDPDRPAERRRPRPAVVPPRQRRVVRRAARLRAAGRDPRSRLRS